MLMTKTQTEFYLKRLRLFDTPAQIARDIGASRPSVDRWLAGEGLPRLSMLKRFEQAYVALLYRLREDGWEDIADILDEDAPEGSEDHAYSSVACQKWLKKVLRQPAKYSLIMAKATKDGFTRSQVSYAAKRLGVRRDSIAGKKHGAQKAHSIWRLGDHEE